MSKFRGKTIHVRQYFQISGYLIIETFGIPYYRNLIIETFPPTSYPASAGLIGIWGSPGPCNWARPWPGLGPDPGPEQKCFLREFVQTHVILAPGACGWVGPSCGAWLTSAS